MGRMEPQGVGVLARNEDLVLGAGHGLLEVEGDQVSDAIKLQAAGQKRTSSVYPRPGGGYLVFLYGGSTYRRRQAKTYGWAEYVGRRWVKDGVVLGMPSV